MALRNKKGFTLIEVIVSIGIIGIMSVGFLSIFASGFKGIVGAGSRSNASFATQGKVEEALKAKPSPGAIGNTKLSFTFSDTSKIEVDGKIESQSTTINNKQVVISAFNPIK